MKTDSRRSNQGFTLLEVMVALTITGFVLGGLFTLAGGSKQLAWKSEESLLAAIESRARVNFALLENEYRPVEQILLDDSMLQIRSEEILPVPERQTQPTIHTLQRYEVINTQNDEIITGNRWVRLELAR